METRGRKSWGWTDGKEQIIKSLGEITEGMNATFLGHKQAALHTRQPTTGATVKDNSHPFRIKNVLGMHNGVVRNHDELQKKYERKCEVDSEHIFYHIAEERPLSEISAYGAIVFWKDDKLYLGRFNGGELTLARTENAWIFASTKDSLEVALRMAGLLKGAVWFKLKENQLYRLEGNSLFRDMKLEFADYDTRKYGTWQDNSKSSYGVYTEQDWENESYWHNLGNSKNDNVNGHWENYKDSEGVEKRRWVHDSTTGQNFVTNQTPRLSQGQSSDKVVVMGTDNRPLVKTEDKTSDAQYRYMSSTERIKRMIENAAKDISHQHSKDNWPCGYCGIKIFDGDYYYVMENDEFACEACANQYPDTIAGYRLNRLPEDVMMVTSLFKSDEIQKMDCDGCGDVLEGSDMVVATQDKTFMCMQCFSMGTDDGSDGVVPGGETPEEDADYEKQAAAADEAYQERAKERLEELERMTDDGGKLPLHYQEVEVDKPSTPGEVVPFEQSH
jgi:hypothetical protein